MASTSSTQQQPFPYLDTDSILWCTPSDSLIVKEWLKSQPSAFLPSFLNECVKVINLLHDHWRRKDSSDPTHERWAIWTCLSKWPIDATELVKLLQGYADVKFRDGVTKTGVVNLKDGDMGKRFFFPLFLHLKQGHIGLCLSAPASTQSRGCKKAETFSEPQSCSPRDRQMSSLPTILINSQNHPAFPQPLSYSTSHHRDHPPKAREA